jgi:hypothetical protein
MGYLRNGLCLVRLEAVHGVVGAIGVVGYRETL